MIRRPPRSTQSRSSAASDVYKRQVHGTAGQLPVWEIDTVPCGRLSHELQIVVTYLVAEAAGAAMYHQRYLSFRDIVGCSRLLMVNLVHYLDLQEVVARAQSAHLVGAACSCTVADGLWVGTAHCATLFRLLQVQCFAVPVLHNPGGSPNQQPVQLLVG